MNDQNQHEQDRTNWAEQTNSLDGLTKPKGRDKDLNRHRQGQQGDTGENNGGGDRPSRQENYR